MLHFRDEFEGKVFSETFNGLRFEDMTAEQLQQAVTSAKQQIQCAEYCDVMAEFRASARDGWSHLNSANREVANREARA